MKAYRVIPWLALLCTITVIAGLTNAVLTWNPYPADNAVIGFNVYSGPNSRAYDQTQFVAGVESTNFPLLLDDETPRFFAVTATNAGGLESELSREAVFAFTFAPPSPSGTNSVVLTVESSTGTNWRTLATATNDAGFFRLKITGPVNAQ